MIVSEMFGLVSLDMPVLSSRESREVPYKRVTNVLMQQSFFNKQQKKQKKRKLGKDDD